MRKSILITFVLICSLILLGVFDAKASLYEKPTDMDVIMAFSSVGGIYHRYVELLSELIREEIPGARVSTEPGGAAVNVYSLLDKQIEIGLSIAPFVNLAFYEGLEDYPRLGDELRSIAMFHEAYYNFIVMKDREIYSLEQIVEEQIPIRVSLHIRGSTSEIEAMDLLDYLGITPQDIESWGGRVIYVGTEESMRMMADGRLDAYYMGLAAMDANLYQLSRTRDIRLLDLPEGLIEAKEQEGFFGGYYPGEQFEGIDYNPRVYGFKAGPYTTTDLPNDVAYWITKIIAENLDELAQIRPPIADLTVKDLTIGIGVPLHDGAIEYYQEIGVLQK